MADRVGIKEKKVNATQDSVEATGTFDNEGNLINPASSDNQTNGLQQVRFADSPNLDAFGRLRVSAPDSVFDNQTQYDKSPLFIYEVLAGAGTSTFLPNESSVSMTVGTASGDKCLRQTKEYQRYIPGKSFLVELSRVLGAPKTNVLMESGHHDDQNGNYFYVDGTTFGVAMRSYVTGSVVDTKIAQANFNIDKLDGTGASGFTIDTTKANIYVIDRQWLGSGRVRFGVYNTSGTIVYCHQILNSNAKTSAYMTTSNLPVRDLIINTGLSASSSALKVICSAVMIEDGATPARGVPNTISNGVNTVVATTRRAILSIRPKATFNGVINRAHISGIHLELYSDSNVFYEIVYNGTLGGTPVYNSVGASSVTEFDVAGTTVTGGVVVHSGYTNVTSGGAKIAGSTVHPILSKLPLVLDIAGLNPINLSVVVTSFTGTANCSASLDWVEYY